jgi:hypothetical protein
MPPLFERITDVATVIAKAPRTSREIEVSAHRTHFALRIETPHRAYVVVVTGESGGGCICAVLFAISTITPINWMTFHTHLSRLHCCTYHCVLVPLVYSSAQRLHD